ncbi:MAG TPA: hypothetical protein VGB77_09345 [Abditibacteriaceae bacterium]|jgi:hypothetical protein
MAEDAIPFPSQAAEQFRRFHARLELTDKATSAKLHVSIIRALLEEMAVNQELHIDDEDWREAFTLLRATEVALQECVDKELLKLRGAMDKAISIK